MKFAIVALALLGVVAADVAHLNNMYLPPVLGHLSTHQHVSHDQISHEIPQVAVQEVNDNSVAEAEPIHFKPLISQHPDTGLNVAIAEAPVAEAPVAPAPQVYQSSFEQTVYQTSQQQQPEAEPQQYYSSAVEVQQEQQPEAVAPQAEEVHHHVEHHVAAVSAPLQQADYYGQQQSGAAVSFGSSSSFSSSASSSSSGVDTQYAADGGYVY